LAALCIKKTAAAVALLEVDAKDKKDLADLIQRAQDNYVGRYSRTMKTVGGGLMGPKHLAQKAKYQRKVAREAAGLAAEQAKKAKKIEAAKEAAMTAGAAEAKK